MPDTVIRALGDLEGTVRSLQKTVSDMAAQWGIQEQAATSGRRALYERFETVQRELGSLSATAAEVVKDLGALKSDIEDNIMPVVREYELAQARRIGFNTFGKLLWGGFLALVAAAGYGIHQIISLFTHHPGPS